MDAPRRRRRSPLPKQAQQLRKQQHQALGQLHCCRRWQPRRSLQAALATQEAALRRVRAGKATPESALASNYRLRSAAIRAQPELP